MTRFISLKHSLNNWLPTDLFVDHWRHGFKSSTTYCRMTLTNIVSRLRFRYGWLCEVWRHHPGNRSDKPSTAQENSNKDSNRVQHKVKSELLLFLKTRLLRKKTYKGRSWKWRHIGIHSSNYAASNPRRPEPLTTTFLENSYSQFLKTYVF